MFLPVRFWRMSAVFCFLCHHIETKLMWLYRQEPGQQTDDNNRDPGTQARDLATHHRDLVHAAISPCQAKSTPRKYSGYQGGTPHITSIFRKQHDKVPSEFFCTLELCW